MRNPPLLLWATALGLTLAAAPVVAQANRPIHPTAKTLPPAANTSHSKGALLDPTAGADSLWVKALSEGDLESPRYWRQTKGQSGDLTFIFLPFRPTTAARVATMRVIAHTPATPVNGHPAYLMTAQFDFSLASMPKTRYSARATVVAVNYGTRGWRLDNVLGLRTSGWKTEHVGSLAIHIPKDSVVSPEWRDAAHFADSLAKAYGVHFPLGIPVYAAPRAAWAVGVDSEPLGVSRLAYYDPKTGTIVAPLNGLADAPGVARHEITHAVMEQVLRHRHLSWATTEGIAVYYGGAYGCPTSEAFIRQFADSAEDARSSVDLDMALAHLAGSDNTGSSGHVGLLGAILAISMADSQGGPKEVRALLLADSVTKPGNDLEAIFAATRMSDILHVDGRLSDALFDFGKARAHTNATSRDPGIRSRASAVCRNEKVRAD